MKLTKKNVRNSSVLLSLSCVLYMSSGITDDHTESAESVHLNPEEVVVENVKKIELESEAKSPVTPVVNKKSTVEKKAPIEKLKPSKLLLKVPNAEQISLYVGDIKTLDLEPIKRVAVGKGDVISTSILDDGDLLMLAEGEGDTKVRVWLKSGKTKDYRVFVQANDLTRQAQEINELVKSLPSVTLRQVGTRIILEGTVDSLGKAAIETIQGIYPEALVDLTIASQVRSEKMIHMNVKITEFNTNKLKTLGINWQNSFNGPSLGFATESVFENTGQLSVTDTSDLAFDNQGEIDVSNGVFGFFGVATQITSSINLAKNNGDALIIAEPSLSARSGGEAEFLSGGEVPLPVTGADGQSTVEFKEFGIKLRVKPFADDRGNIVAEVLTEFSTVDNSLAVNGIPGFRTRKAETQVDLKDGQTLVISGLVNKEFSDNTTGLAFLSDIPILGALFRSEDFRNAKSELVIFVTPTIMDPDNAVNDKALQHAKNMRMEFLGNINKEASLLE